MSKPDLKLVVDAVKDLLGGYEPRQRRGRKPHNRILLTALTYIMVREGWSLREAEQWCMENMHLLRELGYDKPNPPSRMAFKRTLDSMDPAMIQRITAKIKHLRGEIKTLWY